MLGPAGRVSAALDLVASAERIDCALLDVSLDGQPVFPVANALLARGARLAFTSGHDRSALPPPIGT